MVKGPLSGVTVLDCTRLLPCAYGTQLLTDLGADVLKIEPPGGEYGRAMKYEFAMSNRHKHLTELELGTPAGNSAFEQLAENADVIVESFRPGVLAAMGLGYDALAQRNPRIVLCSVTGYGQDGPLRDRPGHDVNYLAHAGIVQPVDYFPAVMSPFPVADMSAGIAVAFLVTTGVVQQRTSGRGCWIDLSMSDLALSMNVFGVAGIQGDTALCAHPDQRLDGLPWPHILYGRTPCYGIYQTSDNRGISVGNVEPKFWRSFVDAIGRPDLEPDRLAVSDRAEFVIGEIQSVIAGQSLAYWEELLGSRNICFAPVLTVRDAIDDPHFEARKMSWIDDEGTIQLAFPAKIDGHRPGRDH